MHMPVQIGGSLRSPDGSVIPLSPAIESRGHVYVSGQLAIIDGAISGEDIEAQTLVTINLIEAILAEAELSLHHIVRTGIWLTRRADYPAFNVAYSQRFTPPFPARAAVISDLAVPGALVEIDAVAVRPE